mgnify:CR=1 FL=1
MYCQKCGARLNKLDVKCPECGAKFKKSSLYRLALLIPITISFVIIVLLLFWLPDETYTVSFESYGGSEISDVMVKKETSIVQPESPVKEGMRFMGWYSDSNFIIPFNFTQPIYGDLTLHAKWEVMQYRLYFEDFDGNIIESRLINYQEDLHEAGESISPPLRSGYEFIGWDFGSDQIMPAQAITARPMFVLKGLDYEVVNDEIVIKNYTGSLEALIIPEMIEGLPVVRIGDFAFINMQLSSVIIPKTLKRIGHYAFAENQLISLTIPESVKSIGNKAFWLNQLTSIKISSGIETIGESAFRFNRLSTVMIPGSVISVGKDAFLNNQLTEVIINGEIKRFNDTWDSIGFPNELKP